MRVLQLCNKPPLPAVDGGCLAMHAITQGLLDAGIQVKIFSIVTQKHPFQQEKIPADYLQQTGFEFSFIDTAVKPAAALRNIFSSDSLNISRFYSKEVENKIKHILHNEKFDIVQLESVYMSPYISVIKKNSEAKIILRAHNAEHLLWRKRAEEEKDGLKKKWFRSLAKKMETAERKTFSLVDGIVPISSEDEKVFSSMTGTKLCTIPFGMKKDKHAGKDAEKKNSVFHIGAMDWEPNIHAVDWFIHECWPLVLEKIPGAEFHFAGKGLVKNEKRFFGKNIFNHGEVNDSVKFMGDHSVMVVPLHSGGGLKIKIVEAMMRGKAIVTTPVGAEGTGMMHGVNAVIADSARDFSEGIIALLNQPEMKNTIGANASRMAEKEFGLASVTGKLVEFYSQILR
ncbi:MAG: glycosyltransferase [Bacteroidetes bacterium]|nr:glycosyltransferase [Bacteroidota bacterium]